MNNKVVKNLALGAVAFLGISYVIENHMINKKRELAFKKGKELAELEELEKYNSKERVYHTIAEINLDDEVKVKKVI